MIKVIEYLNKYLANGPLAALENLKADYGIKYTLSEAYTQLVVLNYDQIESDKRDPLVQECRSLVLEFPQPFGKWTVVSRSFDRFLNYGEMDSKPDISGMTAYDKLDGSLLGLFYYRGDWLYRTKSMIMPATEVNNSGQCWKDVIEEAIGPTWFLDMEDRKGREDPDKDLTFILELVSPANRIVTRYDTTKVYLLAVRDNQTGLYADYLYMDRIETWGWLLPNAYTFKDIESCMKSAKELPNLEEGYVVYSSLGVPTCKVKSPAYVAAHRLRGETMLTPKRMMDMILIGEVDEYLAIFPEDADTFAPYIAAHARVFTEAARLSNACAGFATGKELAQAVEDHPLRGFVLRERQGSPFKRTFDNYLTKTKYKIIRSQL